MSEIPKNTVSAAVESAVITHYKALHTQCGAILSSSLTPANEAKVARSHLFVNEIETWSAVLATRRENALLKMVAHEYQYSLLALVQGHYRHAFKGLRLVLELTLQAGYLSARELELREWLQNRKDTVWAALVDRDNGVMAKRYARTFFPSLEDHVSYHCALAEQVYRECSECVHGNIPKHIPLPDSLTFLQGAFDLWHAKADIIALLFHFTLSMRYLEECNYENVSKLEPILTSRLGHVQELRVALGGPKGG